MATQSWASGTLYAPGSVVKPLTAVATQSMQPNNPGFETGNTTGWTVDANLSATALTPFEGTYVLALDAATHATRTALNTLHATVSPGQQITASAWFFNGGDDSQGHGFVYLNWYDASDVLLSTSAGNTVNRRDTWKQSEVIGTAPANVSYVRIGVSLTRTAATNRMICDAVKWDYVYAGPSNALVFKAVQAAIGHSGSSEPLWPSVVGGTVTDNEVTWQAVASSRVTWEAHPIFVSGGVEPTWPTVIGQSVVENGIVWEAISGQIEDSHNPQSAIVAIAASKVFAGDDDIIPFCATLNALDWTTANDAGYLAFGLQTYGSQAVTALGLYRSNLIAFNTEGFQMWQVDQDPANMALLDSVPVSCPYAKTPQPVANDLIFLSPQGVRNISIAGASTNLQAGNFGAGIDSLVKTEIAAGTYEPFSLFWPNLGQYWLVFGPQAFVMTSSDAKTTSWSRYVFPEAITDWTLHGSDLYLRTATNKVWRVDQTALLDDMVGVAGTDFQGTIQWPYLDFGSLGIDKTLIGVDLVTTAPEGVSIALGWDQRDLNAFTTPYNVDADTIPGQIVPFPLTAPSFSLRLTFAAGQAWEWNASTLFIK